MWGTVFRMPRQFQVAREREWPMEAEFDVSCEGMGGGEGGYDYNVCSSTLGQGGRMRSSSGLR